MLALLASSSDYDGPHGVTDASMILEQRFTLGEEMVVGGQAVKVLVERSPKDLKLGYRTVLTIMADKNNSTATSR